MMKRILSSKALPGSMIGITCTLIYILILAAGDYNHTGLASFFGLLSALILYSLLSTFWLPTLHESKETVSLSAGITFHVASSFSLVIMMARSIPELQNLIIPYLITMLVSLFMILLLLINSVVLSKINITTSSSANEKKLSIKS
ncbi:hypothetical protein ABFG93_12490 [Pseudalkalibacillus hwajinpoensis]|uniref:hypothetical protein n=1 Tax=Guptibacillus hwajinpoensis TaxID=208199 RepID=UPI00325A891F